MERLMTVDEVAEVVKVSAFTIRTWLRDGRLAGTKLGKSWRVSEPDLEAFVHRPDESRREAGGSR